jgi:hypothetical protein
MNRKQPRRSAHNAFKRSGPIISEQNLPFLTGQQH